MPSDEEAPPAAPPTNSPRKPLRPLPVFIALLLFVLAVLTSVRLITRTDAGPDRVQASAHATPQDQQEGVGEHEAIEIFTALHRDLLRAYRSRNLDLVRQITAERSRSRKNGIRDIKQLRRDRVIPILDVKTRHVEILSTNAEEIRLRHTAIFKGRFVSDTGKDVSGSSEPELQEVVWLLEFSNGAWRISQGRLEKADSLPGANQQ